MTAIRTPLAAFIAVAALACEANEPALELTDAAVPAADVGAPPLDPAESTEPTLADRPLSSLSMAEAAEVCRDLRARAVEGLGTSECRIAALLEPGGEAACAAAEVACRPGAGTEICAPLYEREGCDAPVEQVVRCYEGFWATQRAAIDPLACGADPEEVLDALARRERPAACEGLHPSCWGGSVIDEPVADGRLLIADRSTGVGIELCGVAIQCPGGGPVRVGIGLMNAGNDFGAAEAVLDAGGPCGSGASLRLGAGGSLEATFDRSLRGCEVEIEARGGQRYEVLLCNSQDDLDTCLERGTSAVVVDPSRSVSVHLPD